MVTPRGHSRLQVDREYVENYGIFSDVFVYLIACVCVCAFVCVVRKGLGMLE